MAILTAARKAAVPYTGSGKDLSGAVSSFTSSGKMLLVLKDEHYV